MDRKEAEQHPLSSIVARGLKATTAGSLISASLKFDRKAFSAHGGAATRLREGDELRIRQRGEHVYAEIVDKGKVVEPEPSGTFTLADGKTMILEKGRIVGGTSLDRESWLMFALLTDWPTHEGGVT